MDVAPSAECDLFSLPAQRIDFAAVRTFVLEAEASDALTESTVLELKEKRDGRNIVDAVAALANTDGGIVLVGISDKSLGDSRFVGVPPTEHDRLVGQLRSLIPDYMPEVIPVAFPADQSRILLVLRVDADVPLHPVVVSGRVSVRFPGQTVPARREDILRLAERDQAGGPAGASIAIQAPLPPDPARFPFWPEADLPALQMRLSGGLTLPPRVLQRPWLPSAAQSAALEALREGPVPDFIWTDYMRPHEWTSTPNWGWSTAEQRSTRLRFTGEPGQQRWPSGRPDVRAAAHLHLYGRTLGLILAIGYVDQSEANSGTGLRLSLRDIHEAVLGALVAHVRVCRRVAASLDASQPAALQPFQAWFQPTGERRLSSLIHLDRPWTSGSALNTVDSYFWPPSHPESESIRDLDGLARMWLTVLLLDIGASEFESEIDTLALPKWTEKPIFDT